MHVSATRALRKCLRRRRQPNTTLESRTPVGAAEKKQAGFLLDSLHTLLNSDKLRE